MTRNLLFKCPTSGLTVQGRLDALCEDQHRDDYQPVDCPACGASHFINGKTGKLLGQKQDRGDGRLPPDSFGRL